MVSSHVGLNSSHSRRDQENEVINLIRPLLVSLLLRVPADLPVSQRSPDLLMRQRMLGLPSSAPHAYDYARHDASDWTEPPDTMSEGDLTRSREDFVSWISRPPVELSVEGVDLERTASAMFSQRRTVLTASRSVDEDPFSGHDWEALCCDAWHAQRKILVRSDGGDKDVRLQYAIVVTENGEVQLDNLFTLFTHQVLDLHRWTDACKQSWTRVNMEEEQDAVQGAEYINDADDFWAGYSDDEQAKGQDNAPGQSDDQSSAEHLAQSRGALSTADQEAAIKDIVRGAYTLHRSTQSHDTEKGSVEAFLQLVKAALASNTA